MTARFRASPVRQQRQRRRLRPEQRIDGGDRLVFDAIWQRRASTERITHERHGWDDYVERVEAGANANALTVVSRRSSTASDEWLSSSANDGPRCPFTFQTGP